MLKNTRHDVCPKHRSIVGFMLSIFIVVKEQAFKSMKLSWLESVKNFNPFFLLTSPFVLFLVSVFEQTRNKNSTPEAR